MTDEEILEAIRLRSRFEELSGPASENAVAEAEGVIGYRLPPLLRRIYLEVANGGFGPADRSDGILGVAGGEWQGDWADIVDVYQAFTVDDPDSRVPPYLVWLYDWGCAIWTLVDCRDPVGPMWGWDPNHGMDRALFPLNMNLAEWITKALEGLLVMPEA